MDFEYKISTRSWGKLTDEQFFSFCQENRNLRFERTQEGEIIIMLPAEGETGNKNIKIAARLELWDEQTRLGLTLLRIHTAQWCHALAGCGLGGS